MVGRGGLVAAPPPHGGAYGVRLSPPPSCVVDRARLPASGLESVGPLVARPRMAGGCARRRLGCRLRHAGPPPQESGDFSSPEPSRQHAAQLGRHPLPMGLCGRQRRSHSKTPRALPQRTTAYPPGLRLAFGHIGRHRPPTARGLRRTGAPPPVPLTPPPPSATRSVCAQSATRTGVVASHLSCTSAAPLCGTVAHPPVAAAVVACI